MGIYASGENFFEGLGFLGGLIQIEEIGRFFWGVNNPIIRFFHLGYLPRPTLLVTQVYQG